MTLQTKNAYIMVHCDGCAEYIESDQGTNFYEFIRDIQNYQGWRVFKRHDEWEHWCPDCYDAEFR